MGTTKKQVMDVSKPGKTPASATSRPVIVGHGAMLKDPMVTLPGSQPASEVAESEVKPAQAPSKSKVVLAPLKANNETADGVRTVAKDSAKKSSVPSDESAEQKQEPAEPDSVDAQKATDDTDGASSGSEEAIVGAVADQVAIDRKQKKEQDEIEERQKALDKLIEDKTYFVPIGQVRHRRNNHLLIAAAFSLVIILAASVGAVRAGIINMPTISLPSLPFLSKNNTTPEQAVPVSSQPASVISNRFYVKKTGASAYTLTLTDANNKVLREATATKAPVSKVVLQNGSVVVAYARDTAASGRTDDYYLMAPDGYRQLSEDAQNAMGQVMFAGAASSVVSFRCSNECKTTSDLLVASVDTAKGTVSSLNLDVLKQKYVSFSLANITPDKKGLVFLADTTTDLNAFNSAVSAKLNSKNNAVDQETYVNAAKGINWRRYVVVAGYDGAIKQTYPVDVDYTYYGRYWVSPNGTSIVYSNWGEAGKLYVVNAIKNTKAMAQYDAAYSTESFGGNTAESNPQWSPDGTRLLFTALHTGTGNEQLAYLNVSNNSVSVIASGSIRTEQFVNLLWAGNEVVRYAVQNADTFVRNDQYVLTTKKSTPLSSDFGMFVGLSDGNR